MKLEVNNEGDSYKLTAAVLIYTNNIHRHAFATKHVVEEHAGRPIIRPGAPFTEKDYTGLVKALAPAEQPRMQWNDQRLLARGLGRMMWWSPPMKRSLFFKKSPANAATFDGRGVCPCPGLIFMAAEQAMYVYAFKGAGAPTPETKLYQAPFFNVWSRGQVCVGNAVVPQEDRRDDPDAWERMFFGSHFTHPNFTQKDRLIVGANPPQFWAGQLKKPSKQFPERVLFDLDLTVIDLLQIDYAQRLRAIATAQGEF